MDSRIDSYDWKEVFKYAENPEAVPPGADISAQPATREMVDRIIYIAEGENDTSDWLIACRLKDGRFLFISAWCDYTGWGCQEGGRAYVAATKKDLFTFGISPEESLRLKSS